MNLKWARFGVVAMVSASAAAAASACGDIEARRISNAPLNASDEYPCERYVETPVRAAPSDGRCIVPGQTTFPFMVVVHVPETSHYAAGHTFVIPNTELSGGRPSVAKLPLLGNVTGIYSVTRALAQKVNHPDADIGVFPTGIPVRAVYTPIGRDDRNTYNAALPLDAVFATSRIIEEESLRVAYDRSLPFGKWVRAFEPQPPFDAYFPPQIANVDVKRGGNLLDHVALDETHLDDPTGTSREAEISRAEGLEDWKAWLVDRTNGRRVSVVKTVSRKDASCNATITACRYRLDTVGRGTPLTALDAVVSPPDGWIAVPRLVQERVDVFGLKIAYPELRAPVPLEGIVAASADAGIFVAVASRVTFDSEAITLPSGDARDLLEYSASVSTDDRGRFATVLPPGTYVATVEPLEGTGYASFKKQVLIENNSPITLSPPRRTRVRGRALLTDGRPAHRAAVLASAEPLAATGSAPRPRPGRTQVGEDGLFSLELDQGPYVFTVIPEAGTGFPRVLTRANIAVNEADIGVVRIPPPTRVDLEIRDPTNLARPVQLANVRIFAQPEGDVGPALEIGSGLTNSAGRVEILLAQQPK